MNGNLKSLLERVKADGHKYILSREQLKFYNDNGYLVVNKLIASTLLECYKDRFVQICNRQIDSNLVSIVKDQTLFKKDLKPEDYINKVQEILYDEVYMTYSEHPHVLDIVSQLIGEDIIAMSSMLINKPPGTTRHITHQDLYYVPIRPLDKFVASWTAIDDVDTHNGCLYVIPGSHKAMTIYPHGPKIEDQKPFFDGILDEEIYAPVEKRVDLIMSPGDTVFFHACLLHGSRANVTKSYRKAISCHFANSRSCYYVDVTGTVHQNIARKIQEEIRKMGLELSFIDIWRIKSKHLRGIRSKL